MSIAVLAAGISGGVSAQQEPAPVIKVDRIEVTGSNIRRVDGETGLPVQVITRDELERGGVQTAQDFLDRVSAHQSSGAMTEAQGLGYFTRGFTAASLRGLGSDRTLVLLNGRRLAPYAMSYGAGVDLSGIPSSALERVEVLKDGASAIYGTDAIGGVINFILRRDFRGLEAFANAYQTAQGGGDSWRANVTAGYGDLAKEGFNVFLSADHLRQDSLRAADREISRTAYLPWLGIDQTSNNTFPANISQPAQFGPNGELIRPRGFAGSRNPTIPGAGATPDSCLPPTSFPTQRFPLVCRFDYASVIDTIPQSEKTSALARLTSQLNATDQFFAEGSYYRGHFTYRVSPTPVNSGFTRTPMTLPPSSPYYPAAYIASIGGKPNVPVNLAYRTTELGPRVSEVVAEQWRALAGLQGEGAGWDYQTAVAFVANRQVSSNVSGSLSEAVFGPLLRSGVVNPFGPNPEDVLRQMREAQVTGKESDNRARNVGADLRISRDLMALPSGPLALAFGIEGRREELDIANEPVLYSGDIIGGDGALPSLGTAARTLWSAFAEANVPLLPKLEANFAVRTDHYSDFGTTTNPKLTLRWQPARAAVLRASYGSGFRAPSLIDLHLPPTIGYWTTSDPIRCPVTLSQLDCDAEFRLDSGGNPALKPERSRQLNAGIVLEPAAGLSMGFDYYRVDVEDIIEYLGADIASERVVRGPPDPRFPNLPGPVLLVLNVPVNVATLTTSGIDVDLRWRLPASGIGRVALALNGTYVLTYEPDDTSMFKPSGPGRVSPVGGAISRWRHYATIDWTRGPWGATLAQNFQNGYAEPDRTTCDAFGGNCTGDRRVGSYSICDVQARYSGFRDLALALGVRNLLDRAPPWSSQGASFQVGFDPSYGGPRGRTYYATVRYTYK